jgi:hypothetical protein
MIKLCNIQCYVLFIFVLNLEKYRLRALNISVIRKLNPNRDEVLEWWMELHNS